MKKKASKKADAPEPEVKATRHAMCACGQTPTDLIVAAAPNRKVGTVQGNCCGLWMLEFFVGYPKNDAEIMEKASKAWNEAPRVQ